jgi:hypothetical protein
VLNCDVAFRLFLDEILTEAPSLFLGKPEESS